MIAGLASTSNAGAAPASGKKAPGIKTSHAKLKGKGVKPLSKLPAGVPKKGKYSFLLKLDANSTLSAQKEARSQGKAAARQAAKQQYGRIKSAQQRVVSDLPAKTKVVYKTHAVLSGVAIRTNVKNYAKLARISGVQAVYPIAPKKLTNSYAVPFQGAPQGWESAGDRGENASIAIIDTGIDYTHANFGGAGTVAAYNAAKAADQQTDPTVFPTDKVVGGYDLVGDDYNADPTDPAYNPVTKPDNNPLDCEGHGSHVAGTAGGLGENADGSTYTGAYDEDTPFSSMRIGPGVAPLAKLYAYRVFGCAGSTDVVGAAIDRAADPNQDGDPSDRVDVINMSLGSDFGSPQDADSVATDAASDKGIVMAVAAGNNGDLYDTGGSPGNAPKALAVAASQDAQSVVDALNITAPAAAQYPAERSIAFDYSEGDLAGNVVRLSSANADGCAAYSAADKAAATGKIVFLEWTDDDTVRKCGSVARGTNANNAGAIGFIFGDDQENFAAGITGVAEIPGVLVAKSGADAIRSQLAAGTTVTVGSTERNGVTQNDPSLNNTLASFSSRGSRGNLTGTDVVKPDVTAVGGTVFSTSSGTGNEGENESGTSMATPMTAGTAGLIRSQHPEWTAEQVKADIMNTAGADITTEADGEGETYAPNRVGSGRIDINDAVDNKVLAYVTNDPGAVSASFGPIEVTDATVTKTKTIKVENTGLTSASFAVDYTARTEIPGADYSVSPASVTLDPRSSKTVTVTLTITKSQLTKTIDSTVDREQGGLPREYVADASGLVTLTNNGSGSDLRVPVYSAPRPASTMTQPSKLTMPSGTNVQTANLPLSGGRINQGDGDENITSTVAGFELQATSGLAPSCSTTVTTSCVHFPDERAADLKYFGATSSAPQLKSIDENPLTSSNGLAYFSVTTQGPWRSAVGFQDAEVYIDSTGDGKADVVTYTTRLPGTDVLVAETDSLTDPDADPSLQGINDRLGDTDTALFDSDTLVLPVSLSALPGVTSAKSRISYSVFTFSGLSAGPVDQIGDVANDLTLKDPLSMDVLNPGVSVYGSYNGDTSPLLYADSAGSVLQVRRDSAAAKLDKGLGALIVHFHNKVGNKAQPVFLGKHGSTPTLSISPSPAKAGKPFTSTVTVPTAGNIPPTGTVAVRNVGTGGVIGRATLKDGKATITYTPRGNGTVKYQASYSGDSNYFGGTSNTVSLVINK